MRLKVAPHAVEHLELEPIRPDALAPGEGDGRPDDGDVVRRQGRVGAVAQEPLQERHVRASFHLCPGHEGQLRGLVVGALAEPDPGALGDESLDVRRAAVEVALDDGAHLGVVARRSRTSSSVASVTA